MLLLKRYDPWRSREEGGAGFGLKEAVRENWPDHPEYAIDATTIPTTEQAWKDLLKYNYKDAIYSALLTRIYWSALQKKEKIGAAIECGNIIDIAESYINGISINRTAIQPFADDIHKRIIENEQILGHDISVVRSPKKLANLIFKEWGYTPIKTTPGGGAATDKESLLKLAIQHSDDPRFGALMALRKCNTQGSKFVESVIKSTQYHGDNITRPEPMMSGTYCVTGDVEVLTRSGWVALENWTGGDIVQVRDDLSLQFLPASKVVAPLATEMISVDHPGMRCLFTTGHTIPHLAQKTDKWCDLKAIDLLKRRVFVPTAGVLETEGCLSKEQLMFLVAYQADAWFDTSRGRVKFTLKKLRKIERLEYLLKINGIKYRRYVSPAYPDRVEIFIEKGSLPLWVTEERKFFGDWILDAKPGGLEAFVRELHFWDGWIHEDGGYGYCSSVEENVDWAQTAASLAGFKCRKHSESDGIWTIHISDDHVRPIANIIPETHVKKVECNTPVFCTETVTGYWLARSKGTIFVTGNSHRFTYASFQGSGKGRRQTGIALHQWERGKSARDVLQAPEGYLLAEFDFSGQEMRLMAIESHDDVMLNAFANGMDLHALMGAEIESLDYEFVRDCSSSDPRAKSARDLGKFANLSLQYRIGIDSIMSRALTQYGLQLWRSKAVKIKETYLAKYSGVPKYWKEAIRIANLDGYAFSRGGARVPLNNLNDYAQQQTAINFRIQGTGAEMKLLGIYECRNLFDENLKYGWDLHDALFMFVKDDEYALGKVKNVQSVLSNLPYKDAWGWDVPIPLPVDAKLGKTWGSLKGV